MGKSYVTIEQAICPVCGIPHDTGTILLDRRLQPTFERKTATRYELCPEHEKLRDDGFVALIECSNQPQRLADANRTGNIAHIRAEVFTRVFNVPVPEKLIAFVEIGVIDKLKEMTASGDS